MLIVVLGGSLAVVGYPAAGAPRRPLAGGTRPHQARPATAASGSNVNDPPGTGASSEWARTHSSRPRPTSADPTPPASQPPQSQDPPPSAAPSATAGKPTASAPAPQSQQPSPHPSTGHAGGQPGTPRAVTRPSEGPPTPDDAPRLRQRPRAPTVQSIEPEAIPSDAGVLPAPTPATPPSDPSGEAAALPVNNPTSGEPAAIDRPLTLIWSGLFALLIALAGMAMVTHRRRQW